jgi:chemotaxis methyl-accepting protein methylase
MSKRDTQFQEWAKLVEQEIYAVLLSSRDVADVRGTIRQIMARHGYDLMKHGAKHINKNAIYTEAPRFDAFMLAIVPDMTKWPEEDE